MVQIMSVPPQENEVSVCPVGLNLVSLGLDLLDLESRTVGRENRLLTGATSSHPYRVNVSRRPRRFLLRSISDWILLHRFRFVVPYSLVGYRIWEIV